MISPLTIQLAKSRSKELIQDPQEILAVMRSRAGGDAEASLTDEGVQVRRSCALTSGSSGKNFETPSATTIQRLVEARGMPYRPEFEDRTVWYYMSDERVDSEGDIIRQNWDFSEFAKNSPMPFNHEWFNAPIGRMIDWFTQPRNEADYSGPALVGLGLFATEEMSEQADSVFRLVKGGFLPSGSVGFIAKEILNIKDPDERSALGLGQWGVVFNRSTLLEFSPTTIPANPGAHVAASFGKLKRCDVGVLRELKLSHSDAESEDFKSWDSWLTGMAHEVFGHKAYSMPNEETTEDVTEDTAEEVTATETEEKSTELAEIKELLGELVKAFNAMSTQVKAATNDLQHSIDTLHEKGLIESKALDADSEESEESEETETKDLPGCNFKGQLSDALQNLDSLVG